MRAASAWGRRAGLLRASSMRLTSACMAVAARLGRQGVEHLLRFVERAAGDQPFGQVSVTSRCPGSASSAWASSSMRLVFLAGFTAAWPRARSSSTGDTGG